MSEEKFGDIFWLGDCVSDVLDLDVEIEKLDAESFFQQKGILVVKVGSDEHPASERDIKNVQECLTAAFNNWPTKPFCIVTHHAIDFSIIPINELLERISCSTRNEDDKWEDE